ncbi:MAG: L-histidine N(alpha)-methyltransferase [Betaproteobacteria bacterium]|nr:L-histidine N(alpha)-methyltransferase [Betaproteobacteria bacterium]
MLQTAEQPPRSPRFVQVYREDQEALRRELTQGLLQAQAHCSPKFLYDALGSRLFEAITELPEYYPTRTEASIFATHGADMARAVPQNATLLDLGAGNCNKAAALFSRFEPQRYVAIDISVQFLQGALECLQRQHPKLEMWGLGVDFSGGLQLPEPIEAAASGPRLLFYPGSSIGNFTPDAALAFLRSVRLACGTQAGSGLLIGVDLVKDSAVLEAAYDDALGVTAAFNLNLLLHLNRLLQADFRLPDWRHRAHYDTQQQRIEMHLQARHAVKVSWHDEQGQRCERHFEAGQTLHTENSCKWTVQGFAELLQRAGFQGLQHWSDEARQFAVFWASAC